MQLGSTMSLASLVEGPPEVTTAPLAGVMAAELATSAIWRCVSSSFWLLATEDGSTGSVLLLSGWPLV